MNPEDKINGKVFQLESLLQRIAFWRTMGDTIVFTNGCFDILHPGHVKLLAGCAELGNRVIVGVNSDASVKRLKGDARPVNTESNRLQLLASNLLTDAVILFDEDTPEKLIQAIKPDVLVKGDDWTTDKIVGAQFVQAYGGKVQTVPYLQGHSTTAIIERAK